MRRKPNSVLPSQSHPDSSPFVSGVLCETLAAIQIDRPRPRHFPLGIGPGRCRRRNYLGSCRTQRVFRNLILGRLGRALDHRCSVCAFAHLRLLGVRARDDAPSHGDYSGRDQRGCAKGAASRATRRGGDRLPRTAQFSEFCFIERSERSGRRVEFGGKGDGRCHGRTGRSAIPPHRIPLGHRQHCPHGWAARYRHRHDIRLPTRR